MTGDSVHGEVCACHPECERSCRVEQHPVDNPCIWPDCLTYTEMRNRLRDLREAGVV